jgi:hypothetical protein
VISRVVVRGTVVPGLLVAAMLATSVQARAEDKLFPTDILRLGQFDVNLGASATRIERDFNTLDASGHETFEQVSESLEIRAGLGAGFHAGVAFPYVSFTRDCAFRCVTHRDGRQNTQLWLKYGFIDDPANPLTLSAILQVGPGSDDAHPTDEVAQLAAGYRLDSGSLYATYDYYRTSDGRLPQRHGVSFGAFARLGDRVTLEPAASYQYYQETDTRTDEHTFGLGVSAHVRIAGNFYAIPWASYGSFGEVTGPTVHFDTSHNRSAGLSLYLLFDGNGSGLFAGGPGPVEVSPATVAAPKADAATPMHWAEPAPATAMKVGAVLRVRPGVDLKMRPSHDSESAGRGGSVTLKVPVANAEGTWWYVSADGTTGWVNVGDLEIVP